MIRDLDCLPEEHELKEAPVGRSKENLDSVDEHILGKMAQDAGMM